MLGRRHGILLLALGTFIGACIVFFSWTTQPGSNALTEGESAYRKGNRSAAMERARSVLKGEPSNLAALRLLARASARDGEDARAESLYRRVGTSNMKAEDFFLLGRGLMKRGQVGPGRAALGAALDTDPDHAETLDYLLNVGSEGSSSLTAALQADRLRRQPGWEVRGSIALARIRHDLLEPAAAAELLTEVFKRDPSLEQAGADANEVRLLLASCMLETGEPRKAREELAKLVQSRDDPQASWLLSRALLMDGKLADARAELGKAQQSGAPDPLRREPAPFVGAARCAGCHAKEFKSQQQSNHANTLKSRSELQDILWPDQPLVDPGNPRVTHRFRKLEQGVEIEARASDQKLAALIEYAMGSNHQGRSFVGRDDQGQARELRVSQYPADPAWSQTLDHPSEPPDPYGYLGRPISDEAIRKCVHCHSTNFREVQYPEGRPEASDHGIGCERCHGPGGHHLRAVETRFPDLAIARPRLATAEQVVALCGQCHKALDSMASQKPNVIRFQAPTLVQSRCYTESGTLSCVTCHNPHRNASRVASEYEAVCLQCHASPNRPDQPSLKKEDRSKTWAACPTGAVRDCLSCHMPRVSGAIARAVFTDHHIRIRGGSAKP